MEQIARSPKQIGAALRRHRRTLKLTQTDLGDKTTLRQATISWIENGEPGVRLRTLFDVLTALNLEIVIRSRTSGIRRRLRLTKPDNKDKR